MGACVPTRGVTHQQPGGPRLHLPGQPEDCFAASGYGSLIGLSFQLVSSKAPLKMEYYGKACDDVGLFGYDCVSLATAIFIQWHLRLIKF